MSLLSSRNIGNRNVARPLAGFSRVLRLRAAALQDIYGVVGRAAPSCRSLQLLPWQRLPAAEAVTERLRLMTRALPDPELPAYVTRPWHLSREMLKVAVSDSLRTRWPALGRFGDFLPREQVTAYGSCSSRSLM